MNDKIKRLENKVSSLEFKNERLVSENRQLKARVYYHEVYAPRTITKSKLKSTLLAAELEANLLSYSESYDGLQRKRLSQDRLARELISKSSLSDDEKADIIDKMNDLERKLSEVWVEEYTADKMIEVMKDVGVLREDYEGFPDQTIEQ